MIIGIMSDSHDRLDMLEKAVDFFNSQKLDYVLHAGDYVAPFTANILSKLKIPMIGVFGNNDGEKKGLVEKYSGIAKIYEPPYLFELKGYKIALMHKPQNLYKYMENNRVVVFGHTHKTLIKHSEQSILVNPGELCGYLSGKSTLCTVDVRTLKVSITEL